jgi:histidine triad (HIT) family protein
MSTVSPPPSDPAESCTFCRVAAGSIDADVVFTDDIAVGFLDHSPVFKGHVLVVPRPHVVTLPDLPVDLVGPYFERVQQVAAAVPVALGAAGTFVAMNNVVSQSVAHLHTHVVPRQFKDGLRGFFWPRVRYDDLSERADYAARIREAIRPRSA